MAFINLTRVLSPGKSDQITVNSNHIVLVEDFEPGPGTAIQAGAKVTIKLAQTDYMFFTQEDRRTITLRLT